MDNIMLEHTMDVLPTVLEKNKNLFSGKVRKNNWYQKRKSFLEKNARFLKSVRQEVLKKYDEDYV